MVAFFSNFSECIKCHGHNFLFSCNPVDNSVVCVYLFLYILNPIWWLRAPIGSWRVTKWECIAGAKNVFKGLGDVATEADVARLYSQAVESLGGIDVAVLNAGVGRHGNVEDISVEDFDLQFNTNVRGVFLWLKHILPHMKVSGFIIFSNPNCWWWLFLWQYLQ